MIPSYHTLYIFHAVSPLGCEQVQPCLAVSTSLVSLLVSYWFHLMGNRGWSQA